MGLTGALMAGCTARPSNALNNGRVVNFTSCALPKDQGVGSFRGQWIALPIRLVLDRDYYVTDGGDALHAMRGAIQTWNTWGGLRGFNVFSLMNDGVGQSAGRDIPDLSDCSQASFSSSVTDMVGIWKIHGVGPHRNIRESCGTTSDGLPGKLLATGVQGQTDWIVQGKKIVGASILLNFEEFNAPGKRRVDLESLLLHELGHVLGLLHSCRGGDDDRTTSPFCTSGDFVSAPNAYTDAVMFPFLLANQERRKLRQNDYNRINCLY